jgi:hypothetical protein
VWRAAALAAAAAYALCAAATTPFTWAADAVTAAPMVALVVLAVARWPAHPEPLPLPEAQQARHPYRPWVVLCAVVVAWELAEYLARGSRGAHPTLSSMLDALDRQYVGEAALFFCWLWLGALIVERGKPSVAPKGAARR